MNMYTVAGDCPSNEELALRIQGGDKNAAELLLSQNEGYITELALKHSEWCELEDLKQEGAMALLAAAKRFDRLGCAALARGGELLVMDELGPAEARAEAFQWAVKEALERIKKHPVTEKAGLPWTISRTVTGIPHPSGSAHKEPGISCSAFIIPMILRQAPYGCMNSCCISSKESGVCLNLFNGQGEVDHPQGNSPK